MRRPILPGEEGKNLAAAIERIGQKASRRARDVFYDCPNLVPIALKLCDYLPAFVEIGSEVMLDRSLALALEATTGHRGDAAVRAFLLSLVELAEHLARHRLSVQDKDGSWVIWSYDEPLTELLERHARTVVQVRVRSDVLPIAPLLLKVLAQICTLRDLQIAGIGVFNDAYEISA